MVKAALHANKDTFLIKITVLVVLQPAQAVIMEFVKVVKMVSSFQGLFVLAAVQIVILVILQPFAVFVKTLFSDLNPINA
jgi:hypothetical protein